MELHDVLSSHLGESEEGVKILRTRYQHLLPSVALGVILLVGAYLRLYDISGYMTFLGDEGRDALIVKRMVVDHKFTLLGPTASVGGFFLGPVYYYFMAPFLWAWRLDPTGPAVMVALFGIATIFLVYKAGATIMSPLAGLISASLYALSPVVIAYSRSSWNPNLVPFFSTLLIFILWRWAHEKRQRDALWIGVVVGIGLQLHYLFLFLVVVVAIWFFLYWRRVTLQSVVMLIAGFVLGYSPFLAFELRHGFPNTQTVLRFLLQGKETGFDPKLFWGNLNDVTFRLFGRLVLRLPQREIWDLVPEWQMSAWIWATRSAIAVSIILLLASVLQRIGAVVRFIRRVVGLLPTILSRGDALGERTRGGMKLLCVWLFTTLILFGFYKRSIYDYYFGIAFALPFLMVGLILSLLLFIPKTRWVGVTLWLFLLILNWQGRPFLYPPNNQLEQTKRIANVAFEKTDGKPFNFALDANFNSDHAYRYFFEIWGNPPVVIENEANDPKRETVTDQLIVICEVPDCKPLGHPLWEIAGFGRAEIAGEWDVPFVKVFKLVHYKGT